MSSKNATPSSSWLHSLLLFFALQKVYKAKYEKEKGKSIYNLMTVPPDVQHAMNVAKSQSNVGGLHHCSAPGTLSFLPLLLCCVCFSPTLQVSYKKDAKAGLHYTTIADRPDIKKATQAAKLISDVIEQHTHQSQRLSIDSYRFRASVVGGNNGMG